MRSRTFSTLKAWHKLHRQTHRCKVAAGWDAHTVCAIGYVNVFLCTSGMFCEWSGTELVPSTHRLRSQLHGAISPGESSETKPNMLPLPEGLLNSSSADLSALSLVFEVQTFLCSATSGVLAMRQW